MKPIKQKDSLGCAVACVAFRLNISYERSLTLFRHGKKKAESAGFLCKEIVEALGRRGLSYKYNYIKDRIRNKIYKSGTIVFLRRSKKYPTGHYLCRADNKWMDPWINFPDRKIKAGFKKRLPEKPIYLIYPH
ncbi:MAG: hypothetical protein A3H79_03470 [Candidatus Levybacteria bacterium RIFCSPLOWO2_02_FULL_36_8b]|nr:MAG: hypothetical protein A3H79_03470 [Candidatus Levybacteria bacterium RIFCSPLOWO2_02_FULL_36_8b]